MTDIVERLAEHLYGHSRAEAIELAKEDKFDSCHRQAEGIIELLCVESIRQQLTESQAREKVLRDRLQDAIDGMGGAYAIWAPTAKAALALSANSTALDSAIKKAKRGALLEAAEFANRVEDRGVMKFELRCMAEKLK